MKDQHSAVLARNELTHEIEIKTGKDREINNNEKIK
jgi:hypothetical protein